MIPKNMETNYREKIEDIRHRFLRSEITHAEAKALVEPLLVEMNKRGAQISKEYGGGFKPLTFGYIFR